MWTATRIAGVVLVACVSAAACSGGEDATSTTTSTATSAPTPTESSTTSPETTPPTSSTSTSPTTSSAQPSSSSTEPLTDEQAVLAAYEAAYDAYWAAAQHPADPNLRRRLETTHRGDTLAFVTGQLDELAINNQRLVENPDIRHGFTIESISVAGDAATVVSCVVNPWIWISDTGAAAGDTVVLNDSVVSTREQDTFQLGPDGSWIRVDGVVVEGFEGEEACADTDTSSP